MPQTAWCSEAVYICLFHAVFFSHIRSDSSMGLCWCNAPPAARNSLLVLIHPLYPCRLYCPLFYTAGYPACRASTLPPNHPLPPSWDSKGCYLTRSMTLSRGASLTVSSLMAKIWSPGRSLPKDGPSANAGKQMITCANAPAVSCRLFLLLAHTNQQRRSAQWQASGCLRWSQSLELGAVG